MGIARFICGIIWVVFAGWGVSGAGPDVWEAFMNREPFPLWDFIILLWDISMFFAGFFMAFSVCMPSKAEVEEWKKWLGLDKIERNTRK